MNVHILPTTLKRIFSLAHTYFRESIQLVTGPREFVGHKLRSEIYSYTHKVVAVGDVVCLTLLEYVGVPRLCIADGKTLRDIHGDIDKLLKNFAVILKCRNPPGSISEECLQVISKALGEPIPKLILVDGEEDLLTLAVILVGEDVDFVIYGVPREGVGMIDVKRFTIIAINLFSQFELSKIPQ
ncbi:MAG: GTP-dependent dephospho-CoA kinase family protein [Ignisphaera sp.]|uniref:GTP-dependent dephospho-CoA kinase n=1 Tax=Ignisphaera aggregans TaxID=334771 RepID=A0A7C4JJQ0_9CREN